MSNSLAIAAVTAVLKSLLENSLVDNDAASLLSDPDFSALPPDRVEESIAPNKNQLNLFLYRVNANPGWRNVGLPARSAAGERQANPPLGLDLYYLLSAYATSDLIGEALLGYGMQVFHEIPFLTRDTIRDALNNLTGAQKALVKSGLAEQIEQVRITPDYLDAENMSHIWAALQAHYRPSAAYQVSLVLIESRQPRRVPLPVRLYNLYTLPFSLPTIESVGVPGSPDGSVIIGQPLVILGQRLKGAVTQVLVDAILVTPALDDISPNRIENALPAGLKPGMHAVQVVHPLQMGTPPQLHRGVESNATAFLLHPLIKKDNNANYEIDIVNGALEDGLRSATVTVKVQPQVGREQRAYLLMNKLEVPVDRPARAYSFAANPLPDPGPDASDTLVFKISRIELGEYLIRIQVDGAASPLEVSGDEFSAPKKVIT